MNEIIVSSALIKGLNEELRTIAEMVGSDLSDPSFDKLSDDFEKFVYDKIESEYNLVRLIRLVYDIDEKDIEGYIKRIYAIGKKADDLLKRLKEVRDYMESRKNLKIKDLHFKKPLTLPMKNIEEVVKLYKLMADLFDKIYLNDPESLTRKDLLDITEKMKNWKYRDFNDIFEPAKSQPTTTKDKSSYFMKIILIILGIIAIIFILSKIFGDN